MHSVQFTDLDGNPVKIEVNVHMVACSMLTQSRHKLVAEAMFEEADYLLWLDADHTFPPDAFARLWSRTVPVVGCNYARRCIPTAPTTSGFDDAGKKVLVYTTSEKAEANELEEVAHLGFGVCLIDMRIFDRLQVKAEEEGKDSFLPLFHFEVNGSTVIGEDVYFFEKIRSAGFKVYVDHGLSWEVGHIHEMVMTNAHASKQRDGWGAQIDASRQRFEDRAAQLEGEEIA
jgi:hypothetical protein